MNERKPNSGVLFKNNEKDPTNPAHQTWADLEGDFAVAGIQYWAKAWENKTTKGVPYIGIRLTRKTTRNPPTDAKAS